MVYWNLYKILHSKHVNRPSISHNLVESADPVRGDLALISDVYYFPQILLNEDDAVQESLITGLGNDYEVLTASVTPTGICEGLKTPLHTPGVERKPAYGGKVLRGDNNNVEYLITFVTPLVVIVIMLLCAALIACLLYRRRHTGNFFTF